MTKLEYASLDTATRACALLDLIADTHVWIKDTQGCFVFGNRLFFGRFGFKTMQALQGKSDYDLAPAHLATKYCSDDAHVIAGGVITDRLELIIGDEQSGDWFLTSKWPIYDLHGGIIGSLGVSRHLNRSAQTDSLVRELQDPIDYIHRHFASAISIASLASACNISVSALERRFKKYLLKTPHQYLNEVRLDSAAQLLLGTHKAIGTIAIETGFADHSHFTRAFNTRFGMAPGVYRRKNRAVKS